MSDPTTQTFLGAVPEDAIIARAISDRYMGVPVYRYWNIRTGWDTLDKATRYKRDYDETMKGHLLRAFGQTLPHASSVLDWTDDLPTDLDGFYFTHDPENLSAWRVTHCCGAMPGIDDGPLYCKSCYEEIDFAYDAPARLDANWNPGDGPVRINL